MVFALFPHSLVPNTKAQVLRRSARDAASPATLNPQSLAVIRPTLRIADTVRMPSSGLPDRQRSQTFSCLLRRGGQNGRNSENKLLGPASLRTTPNWEGGLLATALSGTQQLRHFRRAD